MYLQQGDELLFKTKKLVTIFKSLKHDKTGALMKSPVTGHCHKLNNGKLYRSKEGVRYVESAGKATLTHEEHNPIKVPKGFYEVKTVQEYDHFEEESRNVID